MATQSGPVGETKPGEAVQPSIMDSLRRVLLAGVGAASLTKDEIESFIAKLVERGEIAEQEGRKLVNEISEKRKKKSGEAEDMAMARVKDILTKMDIPTRADINTLSDKVAGLSKKIDELKKAQS